MRATRREIIRAVIGSAITGALPSLRPKADNPAVWPTVQDNAAHTGYCRSDQEVPATGDVAWTVDVDDEIRASPVVSNGTVFVGTNNGTFIAVNIEDGTLRWRRQGTGEILRAAAVDYDRVYVNLDTDTIHSIDINSGETVWQIPLETSVFWNSAQIIADGTIYTGDLSGNLYSIDALDGNVHWKVNSESTPPKGTIAIKGDDLFVARNFVLESINREDGTVSWKTELGRQVWGALTVSDDIYVPLGPDPSIIEAYSRNTGEFRWSFKTNEKQSDAIPASPIVTEDAVIAVDTSGTITAVTKEDGSILWRYVVDDTPRHHPIACQNVLYIPTEEHILAVSLPSGEIVWRIHVGPMPTSPALVGDKLLISTTSGKLIAIGSDQDLLKQYRAEIGLTGIASLGGYGAYRYLRNRRTTDQE